jgi:hypothetical protein
MIEFLKNIMDWALQKEEELAKKCQIDPKEIDEQIHKVLEKKFELSAKYEEELAKINKLLEKLEKIKKEASSCNKE